MSYIGAQRRDSDYMDNYYRGSGTNKGSNNNDNVGVVVGIIEIENNL